ncbi:mpv17-like protein 2 isoform X2 [Lycorma delicatula]|uniref:mpv17-like protein 2 isoform X2 n=1 Tax=Lycorma delicatula TaxID=130591 RepID=UPI003F516039
MLVSLRCCSKIRLITDRIFGKYLFTTNVITSGILMGAGDAVEQIIELKTKKHPTGQFDFRRIMNMTLVGFAIGVPQHYFYSNLDLRLPGNSKATVFKKIIMDQLVASPCGIFIFFFGLGLLEHRNLSSGYKEIRNKFTTVYMTDWMFWPPVQFINFFYLPPKYRVIYVNGWSNVEVR